MHAEGGSEFELTRGREADVEEGDWLEERRVRRARN